MQPALLFSKSQYWSLAYQGDPQPSLPVVVVVEGCVTVVVEGVVVCDVAEEVVVVPDGVV